MRDKRVRKMAYRDFADKVVKNKSYGSKLFYVLYDCFLLSTSFLTLTLSFFLAYSRSPILAHWNNFSIPGFV